MASSAFACDYESNAVRDIAEVTTKSAAVASNQVAYTTPVLLGGVIERYATYLSTAYDASGKPSIISVAIDTQNCQLAYYGYGPIGPFNAVK